MAEIADRTTTTVVLHVGEQYRGTEKLVVEKALRSLAGVNEVEANPVAQTATVEYDPQVTTVEELRRRVEASGFECAGCNVPGCICDPQQEPTAPEPAHVHVAVAIGISWLYSVAVTLGLKGTVFYDAGAMLATFVLLGHWFEMRARGGASDSIRALLDLAPPRA